MKQKMRKIGLSIIMVVMTLLLSGTVSASRFTDGFKKLGSGLGPLVQTQFADFFVFFVLFFSLCWLGFSKWFGEGYGKASAGKGAIVGLSLSLSVGLSIALVYGAKFSLSKLLPFAIVLLALVLFIGVYFILTKTVLKEDKISHKFFAFILAVIIAMVALGLLISFTCKDGKCENKPFLRKLFGSKSLLDKFGLSEGNILNEQVTEAKRVEDGVTVSPRAAANTKNAGEALNTAQSELAAAVENTDCDRIDGTTRVLKDLRQSFVINKGAYTDSGTLVARADALIKNGEDKKAAIIDDCLVKKNWQDILLKAIAIIGGVLLFLWKWGKKTKKILSELWARIRGVEKALDEIQKDAAELKESVDKQQQQKEEIEQVHQDLAKALEMPVKRYDDPVIERYIRMLEHTLTPVTAALPEGKKGMIGLLQLREDDVKERLEQFKGDLETKMGKKRAKKLIEKILGIKDKLTQKGISGDEITSEVIVALFKEHAEKEKGKHRANLIEVNLKKLSEANEKDVELAEKLTKSVETAALGLEDIKKKVQQEFERFEKFKGRSDHLNNLIMTFSSLRSNQIQHLKTMTADMDLIEKEVTILKGSCHDVISQLSTLKQALEEGETKGIWRKIKGKVLPAKLEEERQKKIELINKMTEFLQTLGQMYHTKFEETDRLGNIIKGAKQSAERTEQEEKEVVDVQAQILKVLKGMGIKEEQIAQGTAAPSTGPSIDDIEDIHAEPPETVPPIGEPAGQEPPSEPHTPPPQEAPHVEPPKEEPPREELPQPHLKDNGVIQVETISSDGQKPTKDYSLDRPDTRIGSARDMHIRVNSPDVDSYHAKIQQRPDGYYLRDLSGRKGTFIENHDGKLRDRVKDWTKLEPGTRIKLGNDERTTLLFRYK